MGEKKFFLPGAVAWQERVDSVFQLEMFHRRKEGKTDSSDPKRKKGEVL